METCYICERPAVSKEHVPPKCFFPEQKDISPSLNYRKNLITVPSCDVHNLAKSKDDEYLLAVVLAHYQNNEAAYNQFTTKLFRTLKRSEGLFRRLFHQITPTVVNGKVTVSFEIEILRFNRTMEMIARGIYFHHFQQKWTESIHIHSNGPLAIGSSGAEEMNRLSSLLSQRLNPLFDNEQKLGENPDIFYYQTHRITKLNFKLIRMIFYGGLQVNAFSGEIFDQL